MNMPLLLKGLLIGFSVAIPVGPMCILCLQRTFTYGRASGLLTGLGIATADMLYAAMALFGISYVGNLFSGHETAVRLWGGIIIIGLGLKVAFTPPVTKISEHRHKTLTTDFLSGLILALINPMILLFFIGVFAGLNLSTEHTHPYAPWILVLAIYLGSALWWLALTFGLHFIKQKCKTLPLQAVNRISGITIAGFGLLTLFSVVFR